MCFFLVWGLAPWWMNPNKEKTHDETSRCPKGLAQTHPNPKADCQSCDAGLADQLRRAANSIVLNIAEADGRVDRDRMNRFRIARGSALEVAAAVDLAIAWGYVKEAPRTTELLDRLGAMLWRLTH